MANRTAPKKSTKKPISKSQANAVANMMKGMPKLPTAAQNPVSTDDDGDESQGA